MLKSKFNPNYVAELFRSYTPDLVDHQDMHLRLLTLFSFGLNTKIVVLEGFFVISNSKV
jgi:hypothetical protein